MTQAASPRLTIRDVSHLTGVPPHTLRFWEKTLAPLLDPYRTPGGQRRYDESHLEPIREVRRRVTEERQSLAAIRHELLREQEAAASHGGLEREVLADPEVQQAVEGVAQAVRRKVREVMAEQLAAAGQEPGA